MPEKLITSPEKEIKIPSSEDLALQKQELFDSVSGYLNSGDYLIGQSKTIIKRVLEHSIDDGLELGNLVGMDGLQLCKLLTDTRFIRKHQKFIFKLQHMLHAEKNFISEKKMSFKDNDIGNKLTDNFILVSSGDSDTRNDDEAVRVMLGKLLNSQEKAFVKKIDEYYANFLPLRNVKEATSAEDQRSKGEIIGEESLESSKLVKQDHYYSSAIKAIIRKELGLDPKMTDQELQEFLIKDKGNLGVRLDGVQALALFHENLVPFYDVNSIFETLRIDDEKGNIKGKLKQNLYKPVGMIHAIKKTEAQKLLEDEVRDGLAKRGYERDRIEFEFDKEKKTYRVIYKGIDTSVTTKDPGDILVAKLREGIPDKKEEFELDLSKFQKENTFFDESPKDVQIIGGKVLIQAKGGVIYIDDGACYAVNIDSKLININNVAFTLYNYPSLGKSHIKKLNGVTVAQYPKIREATDINGKLGLIAQRDGNDIFVLDGKEIDSASEGKINNLRNIAGKPVYEVSDLGDDDKMIQFGEGCFGPYKEFVSPIEYKGGIAFAAKNILGEWIVNINGNIENIATFSNEIEILSILAREGDGIILKILDEETEKVQLFNIDSRPVSREFQYISKEIVVDGKIAYIGLRNKNNNNEMVWGDKRAVLYPETEFGKIFEIKGVPYFDLINPDIRKHVLVKLTDTPHNFSVETPYFDSFIDVKTTDELIFIGGMQDGKYVTYTLKLDDNSKKENQKQTEDKDITNEAITIGHKMALLDTLANPTLDSINFYHGQYDRFNPEKRLQVKEKIARNKSVAQNVDLLIKEHPELFLDTVAATKDETADWYVKKVLYQLFPEIPVNKLRAEGGSGFIDRFFNKERTRSPRPEDYLLEMNSEGVFDGDPKSKEAPEVIKMREKISEMIATGIYGSYDRKSGRWQPVQFPISPDLKEPVREHTFELPSVKGLEMINLPKIVGAEIIRDRVKGITKKGKEIKLETTQNALGQVTAMTLGTNERFEKVVYSQSKSEIPYTPENVSEKQFESFKLHFIKNYGKDMFEEIVKLSPDMEIFVASLVGKSPKEKLVAIEEYVRSIGYYDFDNKEMQQRKIEAQSLEERFSMMSERMRQIKERKPKLKSELESKKYAGVCVDFAMLTASLLRKAGIPSGYLAGFRPGDKSVTTKDAHGTAFAVWPKSEGGYSVVSVDGTPGGVTAEEKKILEQIQQPSLKEKEMENKEVTGELLRETKERLAEVEKMLRDNDVEKIKNLTNGELESLLNIVLKYEVKEPHLEAVERVLNASRYGGLKIPEKGEIDTEINFRKFIEGEIQDMRKKQNSNTELEKPAGEKLMKAITEFADAYQKETGERDTAFLILERVIDLSSSNLSDIEKKSAIAVVTYLRAKKMVK